MIEPYGYNASFAISTITSSQNSSDFQFNYNLTAPDNWSDADTLEA